MEEWKVTIYWDSSWICLQQRWDVLTKLSEKTVFECCWEFGSQCQKIFHEMLYRKLRDEIWTLWRLKNIPRPIPITFLQMWEKRERTKETKKCSYALCKKLKTTTGKGRKKRGTNGFNDYQNKQTTILLLLLGGWQIKESPSCSSH